MKPKLLLKLLAVLVAGLALWGILRWNARPKAGQTLISPAEIDQIRKIEIEKAGSKTIFEKRNSSWIITVPIDYPAGPTVQTLLSKTAEIELKDVLTFNPEKHAHFQVTPSSAVRVLLYKTDGAPVADFYVGKPGPDFDSVYIRLSNKNEVYLVIFDRALVSKELKEWRDRTIVKTLPDQIEKLEITCQNQKTVLAKSGGKWTNEKTQKPVSEKTSAELIAPMLEVLADLQADDFAEPSGSQKANYGLDRPTLKLTFQVSGQQKTLLVGNQKGKDAPHYVQIKDQPAIFVVSTHKLQAFKKTPKDFN